MRRASFIAPALAAAFLFAGAASAGVELKGVDASAYPTVRASVVTPSPVAKPPRLLENGRPVSGLVAENLGRTKSVVLALDRSQSMKGGAFAHALAAARRFVASKPQNDRIALVGFGSRAFQLTPFTTSSVDTNAALRGLGLDSKEGTSLWDAVIVSARAVGDESLAARVVVVLTDGRDTSSAGNLAQAMTEAKRHGIAVYTVGIESSQFSPGPLKQLAGATGGTYYGARSSAELSSIYSSIARELRRTWRLEYPTAARPGERLELKALTSAGNAASELAIPGTDRARADKSLLPESFYQAGTPAMALLVGLLVLLAGTFALAAARGERLRKRLAPHLGQANARVKRKEERERLAMLSSLFRATEQAFSHWRQWRMLQRMLERADLPLRTVEFVYMIGGAALVFGLFAAVTLKSSFMILLAMVAGGAIPFAFVWFKGSQRINAFENQLPDLLITLAASLKAGHSFKQGLQSVVDEGREPASKELKRVLTEARLGRPMDDALQEMAARVGSKNFDFVITAVTIQRQVGGSLAGLIDMVADTVRQRQQFARKIKGLTAMGRASAYVLMGLPFFIAFVITIMNPRYMDPLYNSSTGHKLIATGLAMMAFGAVVLKKIVSFKG
jgi:tight adherence protein B